MRSKGIISAGSAETAEAARLMLEAGGNAFDAMAAALFMACMAEPGMCAAGGGGFLCGHREGNDPFILDFFTQTPITKYPAGKIEFEKVTMDFGTTTEDFHLGTGSMALPGNIAGIFHFHGLHGKLPMKEIVAPAIHLARNGLVVKDFLVDSFILLEDFFGYSEESRSIFFNEGKKMEAGDVLKNPDFADFLDVLSREGADFFYLGEFAKLTEELCIQKGGHLRRKDFESYRAIERKPLSLEYKEFQIFTNPPPSMGGSLIVMGLKSFESHRADHRPLSYRHLRRVLGGLVHMDELHYNPKALKREIERIFAEEVSFPTNTEKLGNTTHINIVDNEGNTLSCTTSLGEGCGYVIPGTGVVMNNMLGEAALLPNGFNSWEENTRLSSMMSPSIIFNDDEEPIIVTGTGGAGRIPSAIMQVIHNLVDLNLPLDEAINNPRLHWSKGRLNIESGYDEAEPDISGLKELNIWAEPNTFFGGAHTLYNKGGKWDGAADRRRQGTIEIAD